MKNFSTNQEFWRQVSGLHPIPIPLCIHRAYPTQIIRCDILPIAEQIKLCQQRIKQQRWRVADITKNVKGASGLKAKSLAQSRKAIAEEKQRIRDLIYSQIPLSKRLFFEQARRRLGLYQAIKLTVNIPTDP